MGLAACGLSSRSSEGQVFGEEEIVLGGGWRLCVKMANMNEVCWCFDISNGVWFCDGAFLVFEWCAAIFVSVPADSVLVVTRNKTEFFKFLCEMPLKVGLCRASLAGFCGG